MRVFFTGGSGKAGRHAVAYLAAAGHLVTNADLVPLRATGVADLRVDLTQGADVFSALSQFVRGADLESGGDAPAYDAVVHFAAIPSLMLRPDNETYAVNVMSTFNVLDAATRLGIRKIIIASSETTYGVCFAKGEVKPAYLPVDEDHPTVPQDAYALSKVVNEATARSFQAKTGADIYALRINNVIEPQDYAAQFPAYMADPSLRRRNIFAYIDARDLGHMVECCLKTDGLGYQVFNVANDDHSVALTTTEIASRFYQGVPMRRPMGPRETFYTCAKAKRLVGYAPQHGWRQVLG